MSGDIDVRGTATDRKRRDDGAERKHQNSGDDSSVLHVNLYVMTQIATIFATLQTEPPGSGFSGRCE